MKQALHIFQKDVRHLRVELAVSVALIVMCCVVTPQTWMSTTGRNETFVMVGSLLKVLLPMMWLVLIARAVHDERLAGDQQFWITRPYDWRSLLGSKVLFVAVWVMVPFVVMQWMLLLEAGLNPLSNVPGMLTVLVKPGLVLWVPFFAIAAVTVDVPRTSLTVLAVIVEWAAILMLFGGTLGSRTTAPFTAVILGTVTGVSMLGCVVYVYATRRTEKTRWGLVGTSTMFFALLGCLAGLYFSGITTALMHWDYPVSASSRLHLEMHPQLAAARSGAEGESRAKDAVLVHLPLLVEGLGDGEHLHGTNGRFTLDVADFHYTSPWRPMIPMEDGLSLEIPAKVYERVRSGAVHLHVSLAVTLLTLAETRVVTARPEFDAPDGGRCFLAELGANNLVCRYAYSSPRPTWVTARVTQGKCGVGARDELAGNGTFEVGAEAKPDPVVEEQIQLGGRICAGTPVTFRVSKETGNVRMEADVPSVVLAPYVLH